MRETTSPIALVRRAVVGASISVFLLPLAFLPVSPVTERAHSHWILHWQAIAHTLLIAIPFAAACFLKNDNVLKLRDGLAEERWEPHLIEEALAWTKNPLLAWLSWVIFLSYLGAGLVYYSNHGNLVLFYYLFGAGPALTIYGLKVRLRPVLRKPRDDHRLVSSQPIQSSHWGEPVQH
jgi:hypothetical protein